MLKKNLILLGLLLVNPPLFSMNNPNQLVNQNNNQRTLGDISVGAMKVGGAATGAGLLTGIATIGVQSGMTPLGYAGLTLGGKAAYLCLAAAPIPLIGGGLVLLTGGVLTWSVYKGYKLVNYTYTKQK